MEWGIVCVVNCPFTGASLLLSLWFHCVTIKLVPGQDVQFLYLRSYFRPFHLKKSLRVKHFSPEIGLESNWLSSN